ncbi:hypothetical protein [Clostridium sulfidigenes]|uniref:hypothetical protein n=1 Tax=Clostridium sulfidigenes TaxID=318464 RepID=UPI000AA12944|nr:hypothetical protein [Clostridium sulfidigenes]
MSSKLDELRNKALNKPFYQSDKDEKIKYFKTNIFDYDDRNIPYKYREDVLRAMRGESF